MLTNIIQNNLNLCIFVIHQTVLDVVVQGSTDHFCEITHHLKQLVAFSTRGAGSIPTGLVSRGQQIVDYVD